MAGCSILNVITGVEVECYDETDDKPARVVVRGSKGKMKAVLVATVQNGVVTFKQTVTSLGVETRPDKLRGEDDNKRTDPAPTDIVSDRPGEVHPYQPYPDQQFCAAFLSDGYRCCLPAGHKIHRREGQDG